MSAIGAVNLLIYVVIFVIIIVVLLYVLKVVLGVFLIAPIVSATFSAYTETGSTSYISVIDTDTSYLFNT